MKTKSKLNRNKTTTNKTRRTKNATVKLNIDLRRSERISERQLQLRYSLPDSDDSENEADEGAVEELNELTDFEDNVGCEEMYSDDEANMSDDCSEIDETVVCDKAAKTSNKAESSWECDTQYFDNVNKVFDKSPNVNGDIGQSEKDFFE